VVAGILFYYQWNQNYKYVSVSSLSPAVFAAPQTEDMSSADPFVAKSKDFALKV